MHNLMGSNLLSYHDFYLKFINPGHPNAPFEFFSSEKWIIVIGGGFAYGTTRSCI